MAHPIDLHALNIIVHVTAGILAIGGGLITLLREKGTAGHRMTGRVTLGFACVCVGAALIGALFFRAKLDLLGVSLLVASHIWSGFRALRLKDNGRGLLDAGPAAVMVVAAGLLWWAFQQHGDIHWEPARLYAAIGGLAFFGGYDLLRTLFPKAWRRFLNPAEHALRMTSLIVALVTVGIVTLWPAQPLWLAAVISAGGAGLAFALAVRARRYALGVES